jgi:hypothetical protein
MLHMKSRWMIGLWTLCMLAMPAVAMADDAPVLEARLQGYKDTLYTAPAATAIQWLTLVGLGIVCIGVMFMNAHRSHLD